MKKSILHLILLAGLGLFAVSCDSGNKGTGEKADTAAAADANYPLDVCVVSGESLDSMGEPVTIQHEGVTVKFCCKDCVKDFKADPAKYLAKLEAAKK